MSGNYDWPFTPTVVISGQLLLGVGGETISVGAGQMFLAEAGVAHAVLAGSHGTLVIIDIGLSNTPEGALNAKEKTGK